MRPEPIGAEEAKLMADEPAQDEKRPAAARPMGVPVLVVLAAGALVLASVVEFRHGSSLGPAPTLVLLALLQVANHWSSGWL